MSYFSRYDRGDWAVLCDACGRKMKASDLRQRWDGLKVCNEDWEPRQPQDFVRGVADYQAPPWTRPEPPNQFIDPLVPDGFVVDGFALNTLVVAYDVPPLPTYPCHRMYGSVLDGAFLDLYTLGGGPEVNISPYNISPFVTYPCNRMNGNMTDGATLNNNTLG